jgi:antirestriction protein ArdC
VENLSTWAHEMVHAADHKLAGANGMDRAHKEIVAELGGAVLLDCLGMSHDADLGGAYAYITRYAEETGKDAVRACIEVIDRVCNCVKLILDTAEALQQHSAVVAA